MEKSILFIGKWDTNLLSLEERVINLSINVNESNNFDKILKDNEDEKITPDVIRRPVKGYDCYAWIIKGDVKPTLLLKNLISTTNIILLVFNLNDPDSLPFLTDGWGPIFERVDISANKDQKRLIIVTKTESEKIQEISNQFESDLTKFKYNEYFEYQLENSPSDNKESFNPKTNLIDYLKTQLKPKEEEPSKILQNFSDQNENENKIENENYSKNDNDNDNLNKNKEDVNNIEKVTFKSNKNILYNLVNNDLLAEVIESPDAKDDVFIPTFIEFQSKQYKIVRVCDHAFKNSKIKSVSFSEDSEVEIIGNFVFEDSTIENLYIPSKLNTIAPKWNEGCDKLCKIEVDENNNYFSIKDGLLIFCKQEKGQMIEEILFAPMNFEGEFMIPDQITSIGNSVFKQHNGPKSLCSSSSSLQSIKTNCFYKCQNLEKVTFNDLSKLSIGELCFSQSPNLSIIEISCQELLIDKKSFYYCPSLSSVTFKVNSTLIIDNFCFAQSTKLSNVDISCKDLIVGESCFSGCKSLSSINLIVTRSITLNPRTFFECSNLGSFILNSESSLINIGEECFSGSKKLVSIALIGSSVVLGNNFTDNCSSLQFLSIKSQQDIIVSSNLFGICELKSIKFITASSLKLEDSCFMFLTKLESAEFVFDSILIGKNCFSKCSLISKISFQSCKDLVMNNESILGCSSLHDLSLSSKSALVISDEFLNGATKIKKIEMISGNISIGRECFTNCESLSEFTIKNSSNIEIKEKQFINCNKLEAISIKCANIKLLPKQFINIKSLKYIAIESDLQIDIGQSCFSGCSNVEVCTLSAENIFIGDDCFYNCSKLNNLILNKMSNLTIGSNVFFNCSNLSEINFEVILNLLVGDKCFNGSEIKKANFKGQTVKLGNGCFKSHQLFKSSKINIVNIIGEKVYIFNECFKECTNLKEFYIYHAKNTKLYSNSFEGCKNLETVILESEKTLEIQNNCFSGDKSLKKFDFYCKEIKILDYCFCNCTSLEKFANQNSERVILGYYLFDNCSSLKEVDITANTEFQAGADCFMSLNRLKSVTINSKIVKIGDFAFSNCASLVSFSLPSVNEFHYFNSSFIYSYRIKYFINEKSIHYEYTSETLQNQRCNTFIYYG